MEVTVNLEVAVRGVMREVIVLVAVDMEVAITEIRATVLMMSTEANCVILNGLVLS